MNKRSIKSLFISTVCVGLTFREGRCCLQHKRSHSIHHIEYINANIPALHSKT